MWDSYDIEPVKNDLDKRLKCAICEQRFVEYVMTTKEYGLKRFGLHEKCRNLAQLDGFAL